MNKKDLSKIRRPEAPEAALRLAERIEEKYLVTGSCIELSGEKILLLNFFERSQLMMKKKEAAFRTFISQEDYITQDLQVTTIKWKTGSLKNLIGWVWWNPDRKGHDVAFVSESDFNCVKTFTTEQLHKTNDSAWEAIRDFQDDVLARRLEARHKRETDRIDRKMEIVPPEPVGFNDWVHDTAMADKRYLIYDYAGKKKVTHGYCTNCRKTAKIDVLTVQPKNKKQGKCPLCGHDVTFIPKGYFPVRQRDHKWVCLIQPVKNGIVARYFHTALEISRDENFKENFHIGEICRAFYEEDPVELKIDSYEWGVYKQRGLPRWCHDMGTHNCGEAVLYTNNLPGAWEKTEYQYCAMDEFQKRMGCEPIPTWNYMRHYPSRKYLEYLVKAGLLRLAKTVADGNDYILHDSEKTPDKLLGISKVYIKILREVDGGEGVLRLLRQCEADKVLPTAPVIQQYHERFGGNDELMGVINIHMSIEKFIHYADKQVAKQPRGPEQPCCHVGMSLYQRRSAEEIRREEYRNFSRDWLDYLKWSATLKYNTNDSYVLLPPDFTKAHDRLMAEYQAYKDELARKKLLEIERQIKAVLKIVADTPAIGMEAKGLMIVAPKNAEEIRNEGRALHHCVGSYVDRVAKGETLILFVRRSTKPDEPYFTLEYRDGKVAQCRGKNNCGMTKEVEAFVKAFEKKMAPGNSGHKTRKARKAG